ncbi:aminotransferase class III-fold pyridoxal phosphate-dependent enzyme [Flavobacteriaceae bacterium]|nr:aminotransferase class III-fold pyridoxal phosphate-dependent enzyme [Flavobacteriaceae bacterium]
MKKGDQIGFIGNPTENGNWSTHLHFQIMLSLLNYENDFPGVAYYAQKQVWKSICPDPNLLFKLKEFDFLEDKNAAQILKSRKKYLGKGMSLQYEKPLHIVRGSGVYLIDHNGRKYLDTVNNVAHVGHEHARVVTAGQQQMGLLNTNSRYLHKNITDLARKLKETLPPKLSVFHFVNSGSEANELALRMVKAVTESSQMLVSEVGYHGNTNGCIEISSYKFDGKGGQGAPNHVHVFPMPDSFRGKYRGVDTANDYANEVEVLIHNLQNKGAQLGGFILEPILSCGGQVELPEGFLKMSYSLVRRAGGLCISDEVQTRFGRMGKTFWGFELHGVVPDIVTLGKPLGNGHPVAAVVCTEEIAAKFANGMEFFNTFGGNPVSCAIAQEVLNVVEEEQLQSNALQVGEFLKSELKKIAITFPIMGSIRGQGLFLGIELVSEKGDPLAKQATYLVNRMKDHGILMSTDGPDHNVIKIKPPLVFSIQNAKQLIQTLSMILKEDSMQISLN